jgi:flavin reductase (DIM6/NTAB) family NADH-FMN oxidoreductase RutF
MPERSAYLEKSITESPIALVIVQHDGRRNAMTASFFSEVSHHPTSLWVSIAKSSLTHEMVTAARSFSLVVLHERQAATAQMCGSVSGRSVDKCASLPLTAHGDHLFLDGALANIACEVTGTLEAGDHTIFLANIRSGEIETLNTMRRHLLTVDLASA